MLAKYVFDAWYFCSRRCLTKLSPHLWGSLHARTRLSKFSKIHISDRPPMGMEMNSLHPKGEGSAKTVPKVSSWLVPNSYILLI